MMLFHNFLAHKKPIYGRFFIAETTLPVVAFLVTCIAASLSAIASERPNEELSMQTAIAQSLNRHPDLASFSYRIRSAEGNIQQAAVREKPVLSLALEDAFGTGDYSGFDNAQSTLSISWILDKKLVQRRIGKYQTEKSLIDIESEIKIYDIAAQTAHAFFAVLALQERLIIANKARQHAKNILADVGKRVNIGKAPAADQLRAEVNLEHRELELEDIAHELKSAKIILASMWGATDVNFSLVSGSLNIAQQIIAYDELETAIQSNPEIRHFLTQQRLAESEIALAREEAKNRPRLNTGIRRYESTEDYGMTFEVSLPMGKTSRNQGRISALTADQDRYQADSKAKEIQLLTKVFVLYQELKHSYHINTALERKIIPRLEEALQETYKAYQQGRYGYQEWSVVQQEVLDAQLALVQTRLTAHNNTIELERLTGLPLLRNHSTP